LAGEEAVMGEELKGRWRAYYLFIENEIKLPILVEVLQEY